MTVGGETTTFVYDGDGARVKQSNRFGTTVYIGNLYERFVAQEAVIGEVGYLNDTLSHSPKTIVLGRHYVNPVVFAQPLSLDGEDTSVVRITDVQSDRFTLYVDEAPDENGPHTSEAVSYLVLEAGQWELSDGTLLEVGLLDTADTVGRGVTNQWEEVNFDLPFSTTPAVVSQVQTNNDSNWVKTRQRNASSSGFKVALEKADSQTSSHGSERIGWFAIEAGSGTWNGHKYKAARTADGVTHNWYQINFGSGVFTAAPRFIAALATYDGGDSAHLRYKRTSLTKNGVQVMIEEDTTYDSETNHTSERVSYLAVQGNGTLTAKAYVTGSADATKHYYAGGTRVAMRKDGTLYWLLTDHLGSTAVTANADGTKHSELRYKAWGENRYTWGDTPTARRFTGQIEDGTIGLYFYNARYYDPYLNRWIQPDTIVPQPENPQSLNRYSYVYNNAVKYTDPSGHCIFGLDTIVCLVVAGGAAIGGAVSYGSQVIGNRQSGMSWGDALTTDIDVGKIVGDAAGGGFMAGTFYVAGPVTGLGFWKTLGVGGLASLGAGQTSAVTEAAADEVIRHIEAGGDVDVARIWRNALELGFLDPEYMAIDTASGVAAAAIAYPVAKQLNSLLETAGLVESSSEYPVMVLRYRPTLDGAYELIAEGRTIVMGADEVNAILLAIGRKLPQGAFRQVWNGVGSMVTDYLDEDD